MDKVELKNKAKSLPASINIGKNGLTDTSISQIKLYIKKNKLCKIKFLKNFIDTFEGNKKDLAVELATRVDAELIDFIGNTVVLYKK